MSLPPHRTSTSPEPHGLAPPGPLLMLLEARAPWEVAAMLAAAPWLARLPRGDGHRVVVFPGLGASDATTAPLGRFLRRRGFSPYAWPCSLDEPAPLTENIEIQASHIGMAANPLALFVVADRLLQDPRHWQPFARTGARRWFYRDEAPAPAMAAA